MSRTRRRPAVLAAVLLTGGLALTACGSDDAAPPRPSLTVPPQPDDGRVVQEDVHNAQDAAFASDMIIHHRQAITMAQLVPGRSRNENVVRLARRIETTQAAEVQQLSRWLTEWGKRVPAPSATTVGYTLPGSVSAAQLRTLQATSGEAFDRSFLTLMISHHEGAVTQARDQVRAGADERARGLAEDILVAQTTEITEMRILLG